MATKQPDGGDGRKRYDLLILTDATISMSGYLTSLQTSLPQIISISALTACFTRIGLLGYRDYEQGDRLLEWSGWLHQTPNTTNGGQRVDLLTKAKQMHHMAGHDFPEASKTGLSKAYEEMSADATTIILLYTDAAPHTRANRFFLTDNWEREQKALGNVESYGGFGPHFCDWVSAAQMFRNGPRKAHAFCFLEASAKPRDVGYYIYLSAITGGACLSLTDSTPRTISTITIEVLLAWMGIKMPDSFQAAGLKATLSKYARQDDIEDVKSEDCPGAQRFFESIFGSVHVSNLIKINITDEILRTQFPKREGAVLDFAKSWSNDPEYRAVALENLTKIIDYDVRAISLNPVFGTLWRTICSDRAHEGRESLIANFGRKVEEITNLSEKAEMKVWLESSYDFTAEVMETISNVPEDQRFPCVCLDPTLSFARPEKPSGDEEDDESDKHITEFRRDELLEIGRSCDYKILRRLGRILTRLTYINSAAEMPVHMSAASDEEVPKIPMALASEAYGFRFWRILLHIVVPGTLLAARPAALLAALSLRLGVQPLAEAAEREMIAFRNKWNDISIPETWNISCLSLLLDADRDYAVRHQNMQADLMGDGTEELNPPTLLKENDRALFECLIAFKMLDLNLQTTLSAKVGWTPQKSMAHLGPTAICNSCNYPRSVTIMGVGGQCGLCMGQYPDEKHRDQRIHTRVQHSDSGHTQVVWVECSDRNCRAQYVVYGVDCLNVRPKCHYCRTQGKTMEPGIDAIPAPWIECVKCLNRMIWPEEYLPESFDRATFHCPSCTEGRETIKDEETNPLQLSVENSFGWLLEDLRGMSTSPFTGRSLYHVASTIGPDKFLDQIKLFPEISGPLSLNGKVIQNTSSLVSTLQSLVQQRHRDSAPCSLCFTNHRKSDLNAACGRRGCAQLICRQCLLGWYGLNAPGRSINLSAVSCPFCRRRPSPRTLTKYGMGIQAVANLATAVAEQGQWIYAWCADCGAARRFIERVCARGDPPEVQNWACETCEEVRRKRQPDRQAAKPCPKCSVMTQKISGCDHITCSVDGCGAHWCYVCGELFELETIYSHINQEHAGLFDAWDEESDYYEEED